jgi:type I restriction enzyme S subunit
MSQGWTWKTLGEVCKTGSGGTPLTSRKEFYEGGTIPWLVSGEVAQGNVREAKNFITTAGLENSAAKLFPKDTVLVAMYGATAGQVGILRFEATTNQAVCGILPNGKFIPEFLYYFLLAKKDDLVAQATGNAQPNISQIKIKNIKVPILPLPEQLRIVALLDEAFEGLATAKANAERNLHNARDIFMVHLNQILGDAGNDWKDISFGDVVVRSRGGISIKSTEYSDTGIPVLTKGDIKPLGKVEHGGKYVQEELVAVKRWPLAIPGDLIVATRDMKPSAPFLGMVSRVPPDRPYLINQGATYFKLDNSSVIPEYFVYWCCCDRYREHVVARKSGSTQVHIREADLFSAPLALPPVETQRSIIANLHELREEHQRLAFMYERKIAALDELKQSLLQRAFSGEI